MKLSFSKPSDYFYVKDWIFQIGTCDMNFKSWIILFGIELSFPFAVITKERGITR